jgi:hypothetical protein
MKNKKGKDERGTRNDELKSTSFSFIVQRSYFILAFSNLCPSAFICGCKFINKNKG